MRGNPSFPVSGLLISSLSLLVVWSYHSDAHHLDDRSQVILTDIIVISPFIFSGKISVLTIRLDEKKEGKKKGNFDIR